MASSCQGGLHHRAGPPVSAGAMSFWAPPASAQSCRARSYWTIPCPASTSCAWRRSHAFRGDVAHEPARIDGGQRNGVDQHARIFGPRLGEHLLARAFLDHAAVAHDDDALADRADHRQIVADEGEREMHLAGQLLQEPQHLRLGRDIEAGNDLVGEHEIGAQHHGAGDADALALAAGQFVGITLDGRARQADTVEHAVHQIERRGAARSEAVQQDRLDQNAADGMPRIERRHRVLKDHLHAAAQWPAGALVERGDVGAVEHDRPRGRRDQTEQRAAERGLAGAGLADDADGLALADGEIDAVQDRRRRALGGERRRRAANRRPPVRARPEEPQPPLAPTLPSPASGGGVGSVSASVAAISARSAAIISGGVGSRPASGRS